MTGRLNQTKIKKQKGNVPRTKSIRLGKPHCPSIADCSATIWALTVYPESRGSSVARRTSAGLVAMRFISHRVGIYKLTKAQVQSSINWVPDSGLAK